MIFICSAIDSSEDEPVSNIQMPITQVKDAQTGSVFLVIKTCVLFILLFRYQFQY